MKHRKRNSNVPLRLRATLTLLAALMMAPRVLAQNEAVQNAANAVVNGDFENGLNGWTFNLPGDAQARGETTRDDAHSGPEQFANRQ